MLLVITAVLGDELKTAVGTIVFAMTFTSLTGSAGHFAIGETPDLYCLTFFILSTLLWARIASYYYRNPLSFGIHLIFQYFIFLITLSLEKSSLSFSSSAD